MLIRYLTIFFLLLVTSFPQPALAASGCRLNLYIWSEYIDPDIISQFEKKYGCQVTIDLYEDNESMLAKLVAGGDSLYDLIVPSDFIIPALVKRGLIQKISAARISNFKNLDSQFTDKSFDPGNSYSIPYQIGTVGIYLRKKAGSRINESWELIFNPDKQIGSFVLMDAMRETIGSALRYSGHSLNESDPSKLKTARDLLINAKSRASGMDGGMGGRNKVLSGNADLAMVYSGDGIRGMSEDPDTYYFVPKEGSEISIDSLAIPAKAPNREMAENFINYLLEPEVGAQLTNFNQYMSPNKAARPFIKPEILDNPAIYPSEEIIRKLEEVQDLGAATKLFDEIWTQIKG